MAQLKCPRSGCNGHLTMVRSSFDVEIRWSYGDVTDEWLFDPGNHPSFYLKCSEGHSDEQRDWARLEAYIKQELRFAP